MAKFIGGHMGGKTPGKQMVELGSRYNVVPVSDSSPYPRAIYERVRGTEDFKHVATFDNEQDHAIWFGANPNSFNWF